MIDFSKYNLQELRAIGEVMDDLTSKEVELESWQFACYFRSTAREAFRAESAAIDQQARDHAAAEDPSAGAPPAEGPEGLQAVVDALSWCSNRLAALALAEDKHFAEDSQMDTFIKLTVLRNANRSIIDLLADIRDHYDGLH